MLVVRYGVTAAMYEAMLVVQEGVCKICSGPQSHGGSRLDVDHDHNCCPIGKSCGRCVRGLLCRNCNTGLGLFQDNTELLRAAIGYLESFEVV